MKIHERSPIVQRAGTAIRGAVCEIAQEYKLTPIEIVRILLDYAQDWTKFVLRKERHPGEPDKKADEA